MSAINVTFRGLSGEASVSLDAGATVADAIAAAEINSGLSVRSGGQTLSGDAPVEDGQVLVTTAPEAKHGLLVA